MIRDAILHLLNEQPLLIDVFEPPSPSDTVLVGTNIRTMSRTRPLFASNGDSTFIFPYTHIRFVEIPTRSAETASTERVLAIEPVGPEPELEVDEDFLRRVRDL